MTEASSISLLLQNMRQGDEAALAALHNRCWPWMVERARRRLGRLPLPVEPEDIVQNALVRFIRCVQNGRVPRLASPSDLFALLTCLIVRSVATEAQRYLNTAKRNVNQQVTESALDDATRGSWIHGMQSIPSKERTPLEEAVLNDCYQHYLAGLPHALRAVAERHMAGATNREIARELKLAERTIERKLALVRSRWQEMSAEP
jgi:RNA polymerase sigma factor (sigma-70 family)